MEMTLVLIYIVLAALWLLLLLSGARKHKAMIKPLDRKTYPLKDLYPVGFELLRLIKYSYRTNLDKKRLAQCNIVYGKRYGEYYLHVSVAEKVSCCSLCVVLGPILGVLMDNPPIALFGLFAAGVAYYACDSRITDVMKKREDDMTRDFPDMVSKMALLINAGMITREAWDDIAGTGEGTLYEEMRKASLDMQNGTSEIDAYIEFGNRCGVVFIKKFISMLVQNLSKGNRELVDFLKKETAASWEEKKHLVRRQGEAANSKLMIPLAMILIGIFIMILVPIVSNMSF